MAWNFQFFGTAGNIGPAVNALVVSTANPDEVNQVAGVKAYIIPQLAAVAPSTGVILRCGGKSDSQGVMISVLAQVVPVT